MQVVKEELRYQQAVLKHLGFYKGKIDGIWSSGAIEAKKKFEYTREFSPAIPTNGLPFGTAERLPKGLYFKRVNNNTLLHNLKMSDDELTAFLETRVTVTEPVVEAVPVIAEPVIAEPVVVKPVQNNQQRSNQPHGNRR